MLIIHEMGQSEKLWTVIAAPKQFNSCLRNWPGLFWIITKLNSIVQGWFGYFKHSHRYTFERLDRWIRVRLRSILRRRAGLKGRGRGRDHQRWTNNFFAEQGLYSLQQAHVLACQSCRR